MKEFAIFFAIVIVLILIIFFSFGAKGSLSFLMGSLMGEQQVKEIFPPVSVSYKDVRAVYLTAASVGLPSRVEKTIQLIKSTNLNSVVINVKDGDGNYLGEWMKKIAVKFRAEGIYPIARVVVFQDNVLAESRPDLAIHNVSGGLWKSANGKYMWMDPASREMWDKTADIAVQALDSGFMEVNFDYIRFPSDGDTDEIVYPVFDDKKQFKVDVIRESFKYITEKIRKERPGAILSVDIFADSFIRDNGLGIGQRVGDAAMNFDVVSPMIYPSHYAPGNFNFPNPADEPYQVVLQTLESGKKFLPATSTAIIRPWLQDFNMGAIYDKQKVNDEMRAVRDAGFGDTWMVWNPHNIYDAGKFLPEEN